MRPIPIITALLTVAVLFMLVFQRDMVRDFVGGEPATATESNTAETTADDAGDQIVSVVAMRSTAQEIDSAVVVRGETEATRQVELMSEASGRVVNAPVSKGDAVAEGELLCELAPGTREVALKQAEAQLAEARQNLNAAERLSEGGFAAENRVLSARSAFESAQAAVEQAEAALGDLEIRAPFAGLLEDDTAEIGALLQPGALCATIVQLDPLKLVGYVAEADVNRVSMGAQVGARLATGDQVLGQVTFIGRAADPVTRTFRVEAQVANPDLAIRDGQTAEILISSAGRTAHLLPQSALTLNNDGDLGVRVVDEDNVARFAAVELVRDSTDGVWVAGLPDEAAVIVVGQDYVTDGVPVDPTYQESGT
ncbi:efflux RND transporter periplasmic adaptor subunit [Maritimibacter sp. UBA3975]|uniref:efflux RND transporter periplasmic adaptor subunit n=1 Tax=Maritimibacter sp. UBA3975 TaxID=1946833 RepID=UPI000C0B7D5D|nr:efflux RND transporter periplasmic adaptor subunit [Maritimibacter sp. UBA3975]MAM61153.1 efflux transporter periplasmic adaptor subunit [Maritimibacter sp.]|tara:strand:+ start:12129 stop:13232 length:1104 start_codon:yes stop_codon:yes gene_type:complete